MLTRNVIYCSSLIFFVRGIMKLPQHQIRIKRPDWWSRFYDGATEVLNSAKFVVYGTVGAPTRHTWKRKRLKSHAKTQRVLYCWIDRSIIEGGHIWYDLNIKNISEGKQHSWLSSDLCWEMCVKSPERCFIQKGQGGSWLFFKNFLSAAHLKGKRVTRTFWKLGLS